MSLVALKRAADAACGTFHTSVRETDATSMTCVTRDANKLITASALRKAPQLSELPRKVLAEPRGIYSNGELGSVCEPRLDQREEHRLDQLGVSLGNIRQTSRSPNDRIEALGMRLSEFVKGASQLPEGRQRPLPYIGRRDQTC